MSLSPAIIDAMVAAGASIEVLAAAMKADLAERDDREAERLAKQAERTRRSRERNASSRYNSSGLNQRLGIVQPCDLTDAILPSPEGALSNLFAGFHRSANRP